MTNPRISKIKQLIETLPADHYTDAYKAADELLTLTKQEVAQRLSAPFNAKIRSMPQDTYQQKKDLASWVNTELRNLGLAIRCPKTGNPAILIADVRGDAEETSRFRLEYTDERGKKVRSWTGYDLSGLTLELRDDIPRKEGPTVRRGRA